MADRRVVVTGLGVVSPVGSAVDAFWENLRNGRSGVGPITRFDPAGFASRIAGEVRDFDPLAYLGRKESRKMDPFTRYGMGAAIQAVRDAGVLEDAGLDREQVGVLVGSGIGGLAIMEESAGLLAERGPGRLSPFCIPQMICNIAAGHIAIEFGFTGPNFAIISACASGAHCIGNALRIVQHGEADVMVAGGTEAPITPLGVGGFAAMKALSTRNEDPEAASRPFDADRDGFVIAEGAGIVVLEEYERARRRGARIYCELAGYGHTCDAFHITAPDATGTGGARAIRQALGDAGLAPEQIDYINAHGTSTGLNDKCETLAVKGAFGEAAARRVAISSSKSMTGHLLGAAGAIESVICALAIRDGVIPPTINYTTPDPECDLDYTPNTARELPVRACLSNSFGFGGHNAALCFTRA